MKFDKSIGNLQKEHTSNTQNKENNENKEDITEETNTKLNIVDEKNTSEEIKDENKENANLDILNNDFMSKVLQLKWKKDSLIEPVIESFDKHRYDENPYASLVNDIKSWNEDFDVTLEVTPEVVEFYLKEFDRMGIIKMKGKKSIKLLD